MASTPFISIQEPTALPYDRKLRAENQSPTANIPGTFLDAMKVREQVFVQEQGVPLEYEFDDDDSRSCHWVIYASVNKTVTPEERDPATGELIKPRQSETSSVPIGAIRLVPFPHPSHPRDGAVYADNKLVCAPPGDEAENNDQGAEEEDQPDGSPPSFGKRDRCTSLHDGVEPYVKLGRLCVIKEFRGARIAGMLAREALDWICRHSDYFNPSVAALGLETLGVDANGGSIPKWNGLVCVHAQVQVVPTWQRLGFIIDEKMGKWIEEGIPHVGMFQRLQIVQSDTYVPR